MAISLLPDNPGAWTYHRFQDFTRFPARSARSCNSRRCESISPACATAFPR